MNWMFGGCTVLALIIGAAILEAYLKRGRGKGVSYLASDAKRPSALLGMEATDVQSVGRVHRQNESIERLHDRANFGTRDTPRYSRLGKRVADALKRHQENLK